MDAGDGPRPADDDGAWAESLKKDQPFPAWSPRHSASASRRGAADPMALMSAGAQAWAKGLETWGKMLGGVTAPPAADERTARTAASPRPNGARTPSSTPSARPICAVSDQLLGTVDEIEGRRCGDARKAAFRDAQLRRCDEPVELRADQPASAQAHARNARRESAQGPRQHAQRHCGRAADADQARRVRGRPESRDHARQGGQADAALSVDPVHADDGRRC